MTLSVHRDLCACRNQSSVFIKIKFDQFWENPYESGKWKLQGRCLKACTENGVFQRGPILGNQVSKNLPKLGLISEGSERLWVWASDSYNPCWIFYPEFCIATSHPGKFGHMSFLPHLLFWWFRPRAMRRRNSCHCNLCRTNKCDSDTKGRMLLVILTGHKKTPLFDP